MSYNKKELIEKLLPIVKEVGKYHCFGGSGTMDMNTGEMKNRCQCAGDEEDKHFENQKNKYKLNQKMCEILKEITGFDVFVFPGTYSDYYFCKIKTHEIVIAINFNGEITENKSYC